MSMDERQMLRIAKALADPTRFRILQEIATHEWICCGDVARQFPIAQATVSHHLKILSDSGLVEARREGQFGYFRALPAVLDEFRAALGDALGQSARRSRRPR
jgi:ArsR family transcriptional regulator